MKRLSRCIVRAGFLSTVALVAAVPLAAQSDSSSLYARMGGYDIVAAFVDDFFARFAEDAQLVPYLGGINSSEGARIRQHLVDFVCARAGGPCAYHGRDMTATHDGLGITGAHFDAAIRHMEAALQAQDVASEVRQELLAMFRGMRAEIVAEGG